MAARACARSCVCMHKPLVFCAQTGETLTAGLQTTVTDRWPEVNTPCLRPLPTLPAARPRLSPPRAGPRRQPGPRRAAAKLPRPASEPRCLPHKPWPRSCGSIGRRQQGPRPTRSTSKLKKQQCNTSACCPPLAVTTTNSRDGPARQLLLLQYRMASKLPLHCSMLFVPVALP